MQKNNLSDEALARLLQEAENKNKEAPSLREIMDMELSLAIYKADQVIFLLTHLNKLFFYFLNILTNKIYYFRKLNLEHPTKKTSPPY